MKVQSTINICSQRIMRDNKGAAHRNIDINFPD
jgi:hypothetical protein